MVSLFMEGMHPTRGASLTWMAVGRPPTLTIMVVHTAERHHPTMFHTGTVRSKRSGPIILYNTPLMDLISEIIYKAKASMQSLKNLTPKRRKN